MNIDPHGLTTQGVGFDDKFLQYLNILIQNDSCFHNSLSGDVSVKVLIKLGELQVVHPISDRGYIFNLSGRIILRTTKSGLYVDDEEVSILKDYAEVSDIFGRGYKESLPPLTESLGVQDLTNLQPHEYGILKLKLGLDKEHLFFPKPFTPSPTQKTPLYFRKEGV